MTDAPPPAERQPDEIARQLQTTEADLRTLAEQLGAIEPGSAARAVSAQTAWITFLALVGLAALAAWFIWDHWHSLLAATAPIIWIFVHGWRRRRRAQQSAARE